MFVWGESGQNHNFDAKMTQFELWSVAFLEVTYNMIAT